MTRRARTYSVLGPRTTRPSEYELVTSHLSPHVRRGLEVAVPVADWYARYQTASPLQSSNWDEFADPRETTYTSYTRLQARQERELDALLETFDDASATPATTLLSAVRFPVHGLHMAAAYVANMAPASRITIAGLFQAADELRRVERFAYLLRSRCADRAAAERIDREGRAAWQDDPAWQPLRETIEQLLVTYDWGEAFVALDVCLKPIFDELVTVAWRTAAIAAGDRRLAAILASLYEDCCWHRTWSTALLRTTSTAPVVADWIARWSVRALCAIDAVAPRFAAEAALPGLCASYSAQLAHVRGAA